MYIFLLILLLIAIIFEGTVTAIPLALVCLLSLTIVRRDWMVFLVAFFAGILLDVLTLRPLGGASAFFLTFVFLILLYQRKYEIYSYPFVWTASFLGGIVFLMIFGYDNVFLRAVGCAIIGSVVFGIVRLWARLSESTKKKGAFA
jgi:cell shape-determining protein MreD